MIRYVMVALAFVTSPAFTEPRLQSGSATFGSTGRVPSSSQGTAHPQTTVGVIQPGSPTSSNSTNPNGQVPRNPGAYHPCRAVEQACKAAGFYVGGHKEGKGFWKDCMEPMLNTGQIPPTVAVNPADLQTCQAKRAARK